MTDPKQPTVFINVHRDRLGKLFSFEMALITSRDEAIREAEEQDDPYAYEYTMTDLGNIDLSREFSDEWHQKRAHEAHIDNMIDEAKDRRFAPVQSFVAEARA